VGNIAATNTFNILFILGLSAALRPLPLNLLSIRLDVPTMIATRAAEAMPRNRIGRGEWRHPAGGRYGRSRSSAPNCWCPVPASPGAYGTSDAFIGLTIPAIGTSALELVSRSAT
jgi:Ca2+/Na+ antiporter